MMRRLLLHVQKVQAAAAARRWHVRLHGGEATAADRTQHRVWLEASPENSEAFASVEHVSQRIGEAKASFSAAELDRLLGDLPRAPARATHRLGRVMLAGAAFSLLAAVAVGYLLYASQYDVILETPVAMTSEHLLPDGSSVTLGALSRLTVEYGVFERRVNLERGEAFFEVAHQRRAFEVYAAGTEVTVHGTKFEVRLEPSGHARVSVADGIVAVGPAASKAPPAVTLRRGQAVEIDQSGDVSAVQRFDPAQVGAWKHGQLVYRNALLSTVAADFSRYSSRRFVVNDPAIAELRVTGLFRTDNLDDALRSLETVLPVQVVIAATDVYIVLPAARP
jgi:transmembrane sensor